VGPIGYAVAYRVLPRPGPDRSATPGPVGPRRHRLALRALLVVLLALLSVVACLDREWVIGLPAAAIALTAALAPLRLEPTLRQDPHG
jgi:hypothetical protein